VNADAHKPVLLHEAIEALATSVAAIAPEYSTSGQIVYRNKNTQTTVLGVTPEYLTVRKWELERGRFVSNLDLQNKSKVAVLGATVVEDLFGTLVDPIGKYIKINRQNYLVVGIMASKGTDSIQSQDDQVYIPLTTAQIRLVTRSSFKDQINLISISVSVQRIMDARLP